MKIGVFAYNFEHWKTQEGLLNLFLNGKKPAVVFAANKVKLNFPHSKIRVAPKDLFLQHPKDICEKLDIPYHVVKHDSEETHKLIKEYGLDVGVILGARILKKPTINAFKSVWGRHFSRHTHQVAEPRTKINVRIIESY